MPKSSNFEAVDIDGEGSSSSRNEIIEEQNEDLAREYKVIVQYVVFSSILKGAEYSDISERLE
jgi:bacterioferritin